MKSLIHVILYNDIKGHLALVYEQRTELSQASTLPLKRSYCPASQLPQPQFHIIGGPENKLPVSLHLLTIA